MDTIPEFSPRDLLNVIISELADSISRRAGASVEEQSLRAQAVFQMIWCFLPVDAIEAMLAGRCVMFHEMIVTSIVEAMSPVEDKTHHAARTSIVAMDRAFGANFSRLIRYRTPPKETVRVAPVVEDKLETDLADRVVRHASRGGALTGERTAAWRPSPEAMAACRANPAAMAALNAGDAEGFARAMGIAKPSEAFLAAAARPGTVFDRGPPGARQTG